MKHNKVKKRLIGIIIILLLVAVGIAGALFYQNSRGSDMDISAVAKKETIHLWYTDSDLTEYLSSKALEFYDNTDIRVDVNLVSGLEYLEAINKASIDDGTDTPDIYIVSNDSLEKAYLAGLATELDESSPVYDNELFSGAARNAVSYNGKYVACPMYFETSVLLYNKTYLDEIADAANGVNDETLVEGQEDETESDQIQETVYTEDLIPDTIVDILNYADQYSTPENVDSFFSWDVSDIFYNYFFIGDYITVGGASGDDENDIDIYNTESISTLKVYQELNQFFSIDTKESSYEKTMQDFLDGKIIYTIATSDCLKRLDEAIASGEFGYEYGVSKLPDINIELSTKGMSVTNALVINGYSSHKEAAGRFMDFLVKDASDDLYGMSGKISAVIGSDNGNDNIKVFMDNYADSEPIPKMLETANFWVELEICFAKVWDGEDANTQLRSLSEQIKTQVAGETVTENVIEDPEVELIPVVTYEEGTGELYDYGDDGE
jgi:maltose-binding protein MalE